MLRVASREHAKQLSTSKGPTAFILPEGGCGEWDRPGADLYDPDGLAAFCETFKESCPSNVELHTVDAHINDELFAKKALEIFDDWVEQGLVSKPK